MSDAEMAVQPLRDLIGRAVAAAGLSACSQPNSFIEIALGGDALCETARVLPRRASDVEVSPRRASRQ